MTDQAQEGKRRGRAWLLIASLALNLAVIGAIGGVALRHVLADAPLPGHPSPAMMAEFGPYTRALGPEGRAGLRARLGEKMPQLRENRAAVRADFEALLAVLRTEPFAGDEAGRLLARQHARAASQAELIRGLLLKEVAAMSPPARRAFADRLETTLRRGADRTHPR